jgi:phage N-6-adenine-methyltransferase
MDGRQTILLPPGGKTRTDDWATPRDLYRALDSEFGFTLDACPLVDGAGAGMPLFGTDGLLASWAGHRVFCNPPYRTIRPWLQKSPEALLAVYLVPARTDTAWWHELAWGRAEVRFLRGRLKFGGSKTSAPFPSVVLVYRPGR